MANFKIEYLGNLQCKATHSDTGISFITDAANDKNGISPTDLLASSLATCTASMIAFGAEARGIDVKGMQVIATREMNMKEHKISKITLEITFDKPLSEENKKVLMQIAKTCPVKKALNEDLEVLVSFN